VGGNFLSFLNSGTIKSAKNQRLQNYSYLVPGSTDDGGEHGPGSIITSEAGFAHAGAIVDD
jgi:hypothetical protein